TEQSVRFQTGLASIKLIQASAVLDLTEDDFDFLTSNKVWIATDRSRARRCVEACVYGTLPIAVRYTQDAFSRSGWLWPVDAKGEPLKATSYMAVGFYVAKYVNKESDMDLAAKGLGAKEWNNSLKTKLSLLPKKLFRIRMSRNFGMKMLTMTNLSTECLIQLTKLGYDATPFNQILKQNAKREMRLRLGKVTVADVLAAQPVTTNLLKFMRASIKMIGVSNLQSFIASMTQKLTLSDISDESKNYLDKAGITTACLRIKSKWT